MGTSCLIQSLDQLLFCPFHPSFLKPWLEGSMAGVCESLLCKESVHSQSHQNSRKGHWPQVNDSSDRYCLGFPGFPPPPRSSVSLIWLLSREHGSSVTARGLQLALPGWGWGWQRTKLWLIQLLGETFGPWVDTETSYEARKIILQSDPNMAAPDLYSNLSSIFLLWIWNICIRKRNWKEMDLEKRGE